MNSKLGDFIGNMKDEDGIFFVKIFLFGEKVWINIFNDGYCEIIGSLVVVLDGGVILIGWW